MAARLLRIHRVDAIAMTYFAIVYTLVNSAAYPLIAGTTATARHAFGRQVDALGGQIAWLLPRPVHAETPAGYLQWRGYGVFAIALSAWALVAACRAVRRHESRGLVTAWLATGMSRSHLLLAESIAFAVIAAGVTTVAAFAGWLGCVIAGLPLSVAGVGGQSLALWGLACAAFGIAVLLAQLVAEYSQAIGLGAAVLLAMFLLDSIGRSAVHRAALTDVSVFTAYNRSNAVAPGGHFSVWATLLLLVVAAATLTAAAALFARRDVGAGLLRMRTGTRPVSRAAAANPLLRLPVLRGLWVRRIATLSWAAGCAALAAMVVSLVSVTYDLFSTTRSLSGFLRGLHGDLHLTLLALIWFAFAQALLAMLAISHVSRWAHEDGNGVLEAQLSAPVARRWMLLERAAELVVTLAVAAFVAAAVIAVLAPSQHIAVAGATLATATALLIPFGLTFGAVGALLSGWRPRIAVGALATVAIASYFLFFLAPLFRWPGWVTDLSVFQLYGTPLVTPVFTAGLIAMLVVVFAGFATAALALDRRDVAG